MGDLSAPDPSENGSVLSNSEPSPLERLAEAAESMRRAYNRALKSHGGQDPVLRELRWAVGHLAVTAEVAVPTAMREAISAKLDASEREAQALAASITCVRPSEAGSIGLDYCVTHEGRWLLGRSHCGASTLQATRPDPMSRHAPG